MKRKIGIGSLTTARRIGINAHLLAQGQSYRSAGVSRYIYNLLVHLYREDPEGDYTVFLNSRCALSLSYRQKRSSLPTYRPWVRILWEQFLLPREVSKESIALLHSPVNVQPFLLPCKGVVTVTDLSFMVFPESFRPSQRLYQRFFTRMSVQRASHLIAISSSTARDLSKFFAVPATKISVIFPGVDIAYHPIRDASALSDFRRRRNLPEKLILFVGTLEPRKNLLTLLKAYAKFKHQTKAEHKLVLAGSPGWLYQPIFAVVEELGLRDDVLFPGFIPEDELPLWYNVADVFVYPSLYEGFGLPPLEAMACGTPVIVSNTSSLPEVVGDAALLVDPYSPDAWAAALSKVCDNGHLRDDLATRGPERARTFSWARMARETVQVYQAVLAGGA